MILSMWYALKHSFQKDKGVCPKCGYNAFEHGFFPKNEFYCTKCGLWVPKWIKEIGGHDDYK